VKWPRPRRRHLPVDVLRRARGADCRTARPNSVRMLGPIAGSLARQLRQTAEIVVWERPSTRRATARPATRPSVRGGNVAVAPHATGPTCLHVDRGASRDGSRTLAPLAKIPRQRVRTRGLDPTHNVNPDPTTSTPAPRPGIDSSGNLCPGGPGAINHAHVARGVRMCCPPTFQLSVPKQLFVAINLERVDRGTGTVRPG